MVTVNKDYTDTFGKIEGFWQILKGQSGKKGTSRGYDCLHSKQSNINHLKVRKPLYLKQKLRFRVVNDCSDKRFSAFAIEYLQENKKVRETVFAWSYGSLDESFQQIKMTKNIVTLSLVKNLMWLSLYKVVLLTCTRYQYGYSFSPLKASSHYTNRYTIAALMDEAE